jgi:hypothetical protein
VSDDRVCVAPSRSAGSEGKSAPNKAGATSTWDCQQGLPAKTVILMGVYGNMIVNHGFFWVPRLQTDPYNPSVFFNFLIQAAQVSASWTWLIVEVCTRWYRAPEAGLFGWDGFMSCSHPRLRALTGTVLLGGLHHGH